MEIDKNTAIKMLKDSKGKIFGVKFIKRSTGDIRTMSARLGVSKGVKGIGLQYDPESRQLMPVYDMHKQEYRMINLETMYTINIKGQEYSIVES
jgi:hypothetical protein|tara:strand:+ start:642 stop:923 length:282 start_codon:yes stop_codon:yes gene_type:complete